MKKSLKGIIIAGAILGIVLFGGLSFALDDIQDIFTMNESVSMLLLGSGLIGLARLGRRKSSDV